LAPIIRNGQHGKLNDYYIRIIDLVHGDNYAGDMQVLLKIRVIE